VVVLSLGVNLSDTSTGADLGSSSIYSNEAHKIFVSFYSFEDRSGRGFLASGAHARVSRS